MALTRFFEILVHFQTFRSLNYNRSSFRAKRGMHGNMANSSKCLKKKSLLILFFKIIIKKLETNNLPNIDLLISGHEMFEIFWLCDQWPWVCEPRGSFEPHSRVRQHIPSDCQNMIRKNCGCTVNSYTISDTLCIMGREGCTQRIWKRQFQSCLCSKSYMLARAGGAGRSHTGS